VVVRTTLEGGEDGSVDAILELVVYGVAFLIGLFDSDTVKDETLKVTII
jgi:hypothetical protein